MPYPYSVSFTPRAKLFFLAGMSIVAVLDFLDAPLIAWLVGFPVAVLLHAQVTQGMDVERLDN